jgi:hypothetical protein
LRPALRPNDDWADILNDKAVITRHRTSLFIIDFLKFAPLVTPSLHRVTWDGEYSRSVDLIVHECTMGTVRRL